MKTWIFISFTIILFSRICISQNLVPNPSFEEYSACPTNSAQLNKLMYWFNPAVYPGPGGTPDYFNTCALPSSHVGIPHNFGGYQMPHSGMGYSGLITYNYQTNYNYHEFIEVPLTSTLHPNTCYHFEMYINLANKSPVTSDAIGVYFSDTLITGVYNSNPLPFIPQIINTTGFLKDTMNWVQFSDDFTSIGGEKYLIIGNYTDDINTNFMIMNSCCLTCAYFYIDDVSLSKCSSNSIDENENSNQFVLYPNPMNQRAILSFTNTLKEKCLLTIYNSLGQIAFFESGNGNIEIERRNLPTGLYYFQLRSNKGIIAAGKLVME